MGEILHADDFPAGPKKNGLGESALNLVKSYLNDRHKQVQINGVNSFLFLVYTNGLPHVFKNLQSQMVLFADDTSLIFKIN